MKSNLYLPNEVLRNVHLHKEVVFVVVDEVADRFVNLTETVNCRSMKKQLSANASLSYSQSFRFHNTHLIIFNMTGRMKCRKFSNEGNSEEKIIQLSGTLTPYVEQYEEP